MADTPKYGNKIESYKLPVTDVQKSRRNFTGVQEDEYYGLDKIKEGDCSGITETDSKTSGKEDGEYSDINETSGKVRPWGGKELSLTDIKYDKNIHVDSDHRMIKPVVGNTMNRGR